MNFLPKRKHRAEMPASEEAGRSLAPAERQEDGLKLEKGDLPAILLAGFFNFVLPLMLLCTSICLITYFLFILL